MTATSQAEPAALRRGITTLAGLTATVLLATMASLAVWARELPPSAVWDALFAPDPVTLALAGVAVSAMLAFTQSILLSDDACRFWVVGALSGRGAGTATQVTPIVAAGLVLAPTDVLTPGLLDRVFDLKALVISGPATATPLIIPLPRSV